MKETDELTPSEGLQTIIESARRLGVEIDEAEALQWLASMAAQSGGEDVVVDEASGVFGHRVSMLDFSPSDLARFREIGKIVEILDQPNVETALALSGSAAQSKIQSYPGDCDYFERVNIKAPTREEACRILSRVMREKVMATQKGPAYQFIEAKYGSFPFDCEERGKTRHKGTPISWTLDEIKAGQKEITRADGTPEVIRWDDLVDEPGWCKLDWVVADKTRNSLANASNVLDVTWEAPDGTLHPLDGYLDAYFQEVYLDAESIPIFSKVAMHVTANALDDYVVALEKEVRKYVVDHPNYGKAAKRMYNIFRLTGRYPEAAYIRELFDEPATVLYQVGSLIGTLENATAAGSSISLEQVIAQADELIIMAVRALDGEQEVEVVRSLLRLRDAVTRQQAGEDREANIDAARQHVVNLVNNFFQERLTTVPEIKGYIDSLQTAK
ncbi:MAG TPA: hypothetical protein VFR15_09875 [Chloroflexia bacterium]|nr:hypothetical protein [Chloroflexia bacterium]